MSAKSIVLKRKIDGAIYDLLPKTLASLVFDPNGKAIDEVFASLSETYGNKEEFDKLKKAFDTLTNGAAEQYDTIKEIGDWISEHNDAYEALLLAVNKKVDKLKLSVYVSATDTDDGALEVVADDTTDDVITSTQIRQKDVVEDLPGVEVGDYVKLQSNVTVGDILTLAADGGISDSGYTAGGDTLADEAKDTVIATEKGVTDALTKSSCITNCTIATVPEVDNVSDMELLLAEIVKCWLSQSTLPYNFYDGSAVLLNGEIHILGGHDNDVVRKHYKWDGSSWTEVSTLPYDFRGGEAIVLNGEIHILGSGYGSYNKDHYKWDGSSWTKVSTLPFEFYAGCAIVFNGELNILAPKASNKAHYKWDGSSWTEVSTLPYELCNGSAVLLNGVIHLLGGISGVNGEKHYAYI